MPRGGTVAIRITGDAAPLRGSLKESETALERFSAKAQAVGGKMMSLGTKLSLGVTAPLALMGKAAVDAGSDLEETLSKSNTVFGKNAAEIEKWADGSARAFGQSKQQALDAASSFGNMFTQLGIGSETAAAMSTSMTELASDFASFHNADITEVLTAQEAAFRGEYDAVQRFVPTINAAAVEQQALKMGLAATSEELTAQHKALATQTLLIEGAGDAAGDFARTSDGLANSQRIATAEAKNASATLGTGLLPITQRVTEWAGKLGEKFGGLSSQWQTTILVGAALLAAIGPLVTLVGAITTAVAGLSAAMAFLAANPIVLVIAAVAALTAGLVYAYKNSETFRNVVDGVFRNVSAAAQWMAGAVTGAFRWIKAHIDMLLVGFGPLVFVVSALRDHWSAVMNSLSSSISAAWNVIKPIVDSITSAVDAVVGAAQRARDIAGSVGRGVGGVVRGIGRRIPSFDSGGVVPGVIGSPQLILAHGGETVLPTHKRGGTASVVNNYNLMLQAHDKATVIQQFKLMEFLGGR